jgi:threonyl-tRNA synthetase
MTKRDYRQLGPKLGLFTEVEGKAVYLPKGEVLYWSLVDRWRDMHVKMQFQFLHTFAVLEPFGLHLRALKQDDGPAPYRFASLCPSGFDFETIFCKKRELHSECISCLQLLDQMIKIFGFKAKVSLAYCRQEKTNAILKESLESLAIPFHQEEGLAQEGRAEFRLIDNRGEITKGPFLALQEEFSSDLSVLKRSVFGSMERWIALMIESNR